MASSPHESTDSLLKKITAFPEHAQARKLFAKYATENNLAADEQRVLLECVYYYVNQDTDHDGIEDWTGIVNGSFSKILYPLDPDLDGDGIENIFDPAPFVVNKKPSSSTKTVPLHLRDQRPDVRVLQDQLYSKYGILSVNHTDQQAPVVLEDLLFLMDHAYANTSVARLQNWRIIYAFQGHDAHRNIAAYHLTAKAISIGGASCYGIAPHDQDGAVRQSVISTLAHEIGHAFLWENIKAPELEEIAKRFGPWSSTLGSEQAADLWSPLFFAALPESMRHDLPTHYAATNIHEWFADSFANATLESLAERGYAVGSKQKLPGAFFGWWKKKIYGASRAGKRLL